MTTSLKDNAYHVLGLTGVATAKQILQRSNEIVQRLKIDDVPEYELDIAVLQRTTALKTRLRMLYGVFRHPERVSENISSGSGLLTTSTRGRPLFSRKRTSTRLLRSGKAASDEQNSGGFAHGETLL